MSDQSKLGLGQIITTEQHRDAIHVAVAPVVAAAHLRPGEHVGLTSSGNAAHFLDNSNIGVVDPFLKTEVKPGESFWMFLYPGTIKSLRHEWSHPAFYSEAPATPSKQKSVDYIQDFAARNGYLYQDVMNVLKEAIERGGAHAGTDDDQDNYDDDKPRLLHHAAIILGVEPVDPSNVYFSCGC